MDVTETNVTESARKLLLDDDSAESRVALDWEEHGTYQPRDKDIATLLERHDSLVLCERSDNATFVHNYVDDEIVYISSTDRVTSVDVDVEWVSFDCTLATTDEAVDWFEGDSELMMEELYGTNDVSGDRQFFADDVELSVSSDMEAVSTTPTSIGYGDREYSFTMTFGETNETAPDVLRSVADTVDDKNDDYGSAIEKVAVLKSVLAADGVELDHRDGETYVKLGNHDPDSIQQQRLDGIFTRLLDKMARLYNLSFNKDDEDVAETRRETAKDLIGYLAHTTVDGFTWSDN